MLKIHHFQLRFEPATHTIATGWNSATVQIFDVPV